MQCLKASEIMSLRLDKMTTQEEEQALEAHLATCRDCQITWQRMQRACAIFDSAAFVDPPPLLAQKVMNGIHRRTIWRAILRGSVFFVLGLAVIAALVLIPFLISPSSLTPTVINLLWESTVRMGMVLATLIRALMLVLQLLLGGTNGLILLAFFVAACGVTLGWLRLVTNPTFPVRVSRRS